ncbi:hypothetical protein ACIQWY_30025 [Streptomyces albidoflavus]
MAMTLAAASGCGTPEEAAATADAKPDTVSLEAATTAFKDAVTKFDEAGGCLEPAPGTCWDQMEALMAPARDLRTAMNAENEAGPEFWSGAYALINTMEDGIKVGEDLGASAAATNRPDVLGSAHQLADWLDANPTW